MLALSEIEMHLVYCVIMNEWTDEGDIGGGNNSKIKIFVL